MSERRIAITMGDPGGIGPEVTVKALRDVSGEYGTVYFSIIGDGKVIEKALKLTGLSLSGRVEVEEPFTLREVTAGKPSREGGRASYEYIRYAAQGCVEGKFHAMVTAPISKESLRMAGLKWPGHTEMLAELTHSREYAMVLVGRPLRVLLVTTHLALREVPGILTTDLIYRKIMLAHRALELFGVETPRIGVAGLNPHAGEGGLFGREEIDVIRPAIERATEAGVAVEGPIPPDVIFRLAYRGEFDMVVSMYHDQGLIPLKMIAFDRGVNITVGLPIIRTSPDHGTAYDIAWKGLASPESMTEAVKLALELTN